LAFIVTQQVHAQSCNAEILSLCDYGTYDYPDAATIKAAIKFDFSMWFDFGRYNWYYQWELIHNGQLIGYGTDGR
jgi:hypothetical protein